jgi:hypothetical protein
MRNSGSFATLGIKFASSDFSWFFQSSLPPPLRINCLSCPCAAQDCRRRGLGRQGRNTLASPHLMPFHARTAHYQHSNIPNHITFNNDTANHSICRSNAQPTMRIKLPDNYISLFGPEQIEISANLTRNGWQDASSGSKAAQADWDLFDKAPTPRPIKSVNEEGYHIATILVPKIPLEKLEVLAYIIEWKLIFNGKNSH